MRIAVIGPQNTGKSTFISDFVKAFPNHSTTYETYRDVVEEKGLEINQKTTKESQLVIRDFLFAQSANNKDEHVVFDRCVVDNYIYTLAQFEKGLIDGDFLKESEEVMYASLKNIEALVFIPTAVSVRLVDDQLRDTDTNFIDRINCLFIETLFAIGQRSPVKIIAIAGGREERINQIRKSLQL